MSEMKYKVRPMPAQVDKALLDLFDGIETATIGHWRLMGFCAPKLQPVVRGRRAVGTAVTVAISGADSTLLHYAVDQLRPGDILVVDRLGDTVHACWGGGVTVAVARAGAVGGIVDGPITDLAEIDQAGLPMWATGVSPKTTRGYDLGGCFNVPVSIAGVVVNPGDLVLADDSGVLVLPVEEAAAEATRAKAVQERQKNNEADTRRNGTKIGERSGASAKVRAVIDPQTVVEQTDKR